ncbi:MAG: 4-diphosphocytidyl-2-C-methyl-D-erythritol kinase, partial [Granulosicoccus sp.]
VKIHLHKVIPIGAGMGGGSADATFTLKMLNDLFELQLDNQQLEKYAGKLGSDCPFFLDNAPKLVTGTGEVMKTINLDLSSYQLVLVNPGLHIGTAEAYKNVLLGTPEFSLLELMKSTPEEWKGKVKNGFEDSLFPSYPQIEKLKTSLYNIGALYSSMTGSGSTVFGIFQKSEIDLSPYNGMSVKVC